MRWAFWRKPKPVRTISEELADALATGWTRVMGRTPSFYLRTRTVEWLPAEDRYLFLHDPDLDGEPAETREVWEYYNPETGEVLADQQWPGGDDDDWYIAPRRLTGRREVKVCGPWLVLTDKVEVPALEGAKYGRIAFPTMRFLVGAQPVLDEMQLTAECDGHVLFFVDVNLSFFKPGDTFEISDVSVTLT